MKKVIMFKSLKILFFVLTLNCVNFCAKAKQAVNQKQHIKQVSGSEQTEKDRNIEIEKNLESHQKRVENQIKINKETYKNFNKKHYEVEDYDLTVLEKAGVPILIYVHRKTKACVVIIPLEETQMEKIRLKDFMFFKYFPKDDRGLAHFVEHCLSERGFMGIADKFCVKDELRASTSWSGLKFEIPSKFYKNRDIYKKFYKSFTQPNFLKDPKIFKIEKERVLDELQSTIPYNKDVILGKQSNFFNYGGIVKDVKNVSFDDLEKFYKKYIHPSNYLTIWHMPLNSKGIKNRLKDLSEFYLDGYEYRKIDSKLKYRKPKADYSVVKLPANSKVFNKVCFDRGNKQTKTYKNRSNIYYYLDDLKISLDEKQSLNVNRYNIRALRSFAKGLGYDDCDINFYSPSSGLSPNYSFMVELYSNDESLFKKEKLKDNVNKILSFLKNKLVKMDEKELINVKPELYYREFPADDKDPFVAFASSFSHSGLSFLSDAILSSFALYNDPFSKKVFYINDKNEIIDSKDNILEKTKNFLAVYDVLIKNDPSYVEVIKVDENLKTKETKKDDYEAFIIPIKIGKVKNNRVINTLASKFIGMKLGEILSYEKGFTYYDEINPLTTRFVGDFIGGIPVKKETKEKMLKYIRENFKEFVNKLNYSKDSFNIDSKFFESSFVGKGCDQQLKISENFLKNVERLNKEIDNFKKGKYSENKTIKKDSLVKDIIDLDLFNNNTDSREVTCYLFNNSKEFERCQMKDYEDRMKFATKARKNLNSKIDENFLQEYQKYYLNYISNMAYQRIKACKENKKLWKEVKYEDVLKAIKSAVFCEDETYKQVNDYVKFKDSGIKP